MARRLISSGSSFEKQIGYSRAVVDGDWIFVSGTTGYDYSTMTLRDGVVAQCEQHDLRTHPQHAPRCAERLGRNVGDSRAQPVH